MLLLLQRHPRLALVEPKVAKMEKEKALGVSQSHPTARITHSPSFISIDDRSERERRGGGGMCDAPFSMSRRL
jgi:hypothetical protein